MGMFDDVNFEMPCPNCGKLLKDFQTKDGECVLDRIDPIGINRFYTSCSCGYWVEFSKPTFEPEREKARAIPYSREEVEAMGFVMDASRLN